MTHDLIRRVETLGNPRILVVGDLILDRYIWGYAERISQEAPVPLLAGRPPRAPARRRGERGHDAARLGAEVRLIGGVGRDPEAVAGPPDAGRARDRRPLGRLARRPADHAQGARTSAARKTGIPQQMIRVDYETRDPIPADGRSPLARRVAGGARLGRRGLDLRLRQGGLHADPAPRAHRRGAGQPGSRCSPTRSDRPTTPVSRRPLHDPQSPRGPARHRHDDRAARRRAASRPEAGRDPGDGGVLVTLDRDGMALVRADGRAELVPTRPRQVYDITGAGDMVLSVVGLCLASGADYDEAAALGNVAGGLEVEKFGVALLTARRSSAT